ncbi:kinase-like domain-containing protein, partial [Mycena sanguinolenta]
QLPDQLSISNIVQVGGFASKGGSFGDVYRGRYKDPTNGVQTDVALKVLRIFENTTEEGSVASVEKFIKEALVWHGLKHKNILPFLGVDYITFTPRLAMVAPWMPLGSVLDMAKKLSLTSANTIKQLHGVIQGLTYLHSKYIVHGDLCGRNILLDQDGTPRLADFGLADFIDNETSIKSKSTKRGGSTRWMAPELLVVRPGDRFRRTLASDVWAFGCVCGEILSGGTIPFSQYAEPKIFIDMSQGQQIIPYPVNSSTELMSDQLWRLTHRCLHYEPSERPAAEILREEFSAI